MDFNYYFTSDLHFLHDNVVKYSNRPWAAEEQTEILIERWNSKVKTNDIVFHLGDFTFAGISKFDIIMDIILKLNGKIHFIKGNHERDNLWKKIEEEKPKNVLTVTNYLELQIKKNNFILFHYPISNWNRMHYGSIMLHGHEHGAWQREGKILDVGIDNHPDHQLFSYDEIMEFMNNREIYIPNELNFNKGNL